MSSLPSPPVTPPKPLPIGRLLVGAFLVLLGIGWLLDALGATNLDWDLILPVGLILVGAVLVVAGWQGRGRGGLIALGVVLTVALTVGTVVRIPLSGGVGDRTERPVSLRDATYELTIGRLTVDLSDLTYSPGRDPTAAKIEARVGIGDLVVIVPPRFLCVSAHARAGLGEVDVFGRAEGGVAPEYRTAVMSCVSAPAINLNLSVGLGQVEVRRG